MVELNETEKARIYKMRVDKKRKENVRNIGILLEKIKDYNLFKARKEKRLIQEILEVFSKNEEEEKGGPYYKAAVEAIEQADKEYDIFTQLKEDLKKKEEEEAEKDREMKEIELDKEDATKLGVQMKLRRKLKEERENIRMEIKKKKEEIRQKEREIMVIEEKVGKKLEIDEGVIDDENINSNNGTILTRKIRKKTVTLGEYYEQTIKDLWEKYLKRREIIKILEGGEGMGDEGNDLLKKIKKEVSDIFFIYYDKKQGGLSMKAARRDRNNKRERNQKKVTSREKREKFIIQRYEKKLNIDKLISLLMLIENLSNERKEDENLSNERKEEIKSKIRKNFYDSLDKASKDSEGYISPDIQYQNTEEFRNQIEIKIEKLKEGIENKKEEIAKKEKELDRIEEELDQISKKAIKLENGSWLSLWLKKRKYKKNNMRRDILVTQSKKIRGEIGVLEKEKVELKLLIQEYELFKEEDKEMIQKKISEIFSKKEKYKTPETLLEYKEEYEKRIKYIESCMKNELAEIEKMDLGIDEDEKKKILEEIKVIMKQEIENMKLGDEIIKELYRVEEWLNENWEKKVKKLLDLEGKIKKKEEEIEKLGGNEETKEQEFRLKDELIQLQKEKKLIETELNQKLYKYDKTSVSLNELVIETFGERTQRLHMEYAKMEKVNDAGTINSEETKKNNGGKQSNDYNGDNSSNLQTIKKEEGKKDNEILEDINQWCDSFSASITGVSNKYTLINLFKKLIKENKLKISSNNKLRRIIDLDILDYEIGMLNLGALNNKKFRMTRRNSNIDNKTQYFETNKEGLTKILQQCSNEWQVASQTDIQDILKILSKNYQLISGRSGNIHDEDIAFFMLITKSDGEFLLKRDKIGGKNRVLKCYHDFRGFKDMKENGTGQIIVIRKKR